MLDDLVSESSKILIPVWFHAADNLMSPETQCQMNFQFIGGGVPKKLI